MKNKNGIPEKIKVATTNRDTNKKAVETAEKTIKDAKQVVKNLEPLKETRGQAVKNLNEQKESTTRQYNQDTQKMRQLEKDITVLENTIKTFAPGLLSAEKAIADATGKVTAAQSALDAMNTAIIEKDVKIVEAKAVVDEKEGLLVEIKTEMRHLPGEAERLQEYKTGLSVQLEEAKMALSIVNEKAIRAQTEKTNNPLRQGSNESVVDNGGGGTTGGWGTSMTTGGTLDMTLTTTTTTGGTGLDGTTGTTTSGANDIGVCGSSCGECAIGQYFAKDAPEGTCNFICAGNITSVTCGPLCKEDYEKNDEGVCKKKGICGNKIVEEGEECDVGNTLSAICDTSCNLIIKCSDPNSTYNSDASIQQGKSVCYCNDGYNISSSGICEKPDTCRIIDSIVSISLTGDGQTNSNMPGCASGNAPKNIHYEITSPASSSAPFDGGQLTWECGSTQCPAMNCLKFTYRDFYTACK